MVRLTLTAAGAAALIGAVLTGSTATATDSSDALRPGPNWERYHQEDVTVPAGERCPFKVREKVVYDREYYKTVAEYPDGTPQAQLFRGPLIMRFVNARTGSSVVRNLTGRSLIQYHPDGSLASLTNRKGHFAGGVGPGGEPRRGIYYVSGRWSTLTEDEDGTRHLGLGPNGKSENLCRTLARG
jgi:hypothetical protein